MEQLWSRMGKIYGHRWTSAFGTADDDGTWLAGLGDLTPALLRDGLRRCIHDRRDSWPPTLPEFRNLCLGLPDIDAAVLEALAGSQSPLAKRMRDTLPSFDRQRMSRAELVRHYRAVHAQAVAVETQQLLELTHLRDGKALA